MLSVRSAISSLAFKIGGVVLLYTLCRILFIAFNHSEFSFGRLSDLFLLLFFGVRFDLSAIFLTNSLLIVLSLIPGPFTIGKAYRLIQKVLFVFVNSVCLLANIADVAYFPFVHKRMSSEALLFITGEKGKDFTHLLPSLVLEHWYLVLFYVAVVISLFKIYQLSLKRNVEVKGNLNRYLSSTLTLLLLGGLTVLVIRGGFQKKPLNIIHASEVADVGNMPVVLNTTFTIVKTLKKKPLSELKFFNESELNNCDKGMHLPAASVKPNNLNVVIIMVESLSRNYISYFGGKSKTPFLDSLFAQSLVFDNGFANAKESIQGIPAVLSSIPSLQDDPFIFSNYSANRISSVANLLKQLGYQSYFFHGGGNGTMGFNSYCKLAGFDNYVGRDEYNNEKDFDGKWGIWDEPFLKYTGDELSKVRQPFVASIFTLNTHHPFKVPEKYKARFKQEGHPILACVRYADYSLQQFFSRIKSAPWYKNTLFVITADHTGPRVVEKDDAVLNDYRIPIVFFKPDGSLKALSQKVANQIDILPSVMYILNYPYPFFSQGRNLFGNTCSNFSVDYRSGVYQYIDSTYCYQFDGEKSIGFYNWKSDSTFNKNLDKKKFSAEIAASESNLKKFIQVFNNTMVNNQMMISPSK